MGSQDTTPPRMHASKRTSTNNATKKVNETRNSSPSTNNDKKSTDTPVDETGAQMLMTGLKMDNFDDSPYFLMFLYNAIQNEETTTDHMIGTIFKSITSHEHILSQAKGDINRNWVLIDNKFTVHVICNPKLLNNIQRTDRTMRIFCNAGVNTTDMVGEMPGVGEV